MGDTVRIDSASLTDRGIEVIEARWLFDVSPADVEVLGKSQGTRRWFESAIGLGPPPNFAVDARQRASPHLAATGQFAEARVHFMKALKVDHRKQTTRGMIGKLDAIAR